MRFPLMLIVALPGVCSATVKYQLSPDVSKRELNVTIRVDNPGPSETFCIPGWSPGYYVMQKYGKKISAFTAATESGTPLSVTHLDANSWTVATQANQPAIVTYHVQGDDVGLGFFGASVGRSEAYTNGAASFMYVVGRKGEATSLSVHVPDGWNLATAMDPDGKDSFTAHDYDELIDEPLQMGKFSERDFTVAGIPFKAIFQPLDGDRIRLNLDEQTQVLRKISEPAIKLFGGAPFKRYVYFFHLTGQGFQGGLEHRSGTVIAVPNMDDPDLSDLAAHEFFHAWNVKQMRPSVLGPFDYTQPQRTGNLWFAEGVTDYYSKIITYRSGVHDLNWLLGELRDQVDQYQHGKDRQTNTVEDASRSAWEHDGFNEGSDLDYYNKGLLAGLIFDAKIRQVTDGKKSLDDVMRLMYKSYQLPNPGYQENGIKEAINQVAGKDLSDLYDLVIRSTQELPYGELSSIGLELVNPGTNVRLAMGGYPTPTENVDSTELDRVGIQNSDKFFAFSAPTAENQALVELTRGSGQASVSVPLVPRRFPVYELVVNPTPTQMQSALFRGWSAK